jgi:hypothetical protein
MHFQSKPYIRVIFFFSEIMIEGAVDPLNGWHFKVPGYLNSWQQMCPS